MFNSPPPIININCLNSSITNIPHTSLTDKIILHKLDSTKIFLKQNNNVLVTKAGKGNVTMNTDKNDYIKMVELAP